MAHLIVWRFRVRPEHIVGFERAYGPEGEWAQLFRKSTGYLGTELVRDSSVPGLYLTLDRWRSAADYDAMLRGHVGDYTRLDAECAVLTLTEDKLGAFEAVGPALHS